MSKFSILEYYSRKDVQQALLETGKNREVVGVYPSGNFDKRPNIIAYPDDILQLVKKGVVAFHGSLEHWSNPMSLSTEMTPLDLDKLRIGWDLIIDPDCPDFEISKLAVKVIIGALDDHGVKNYSIKFTGGKGFHIGISFDTLPKVVNQKSIESLYPEIPRAAIEYLKNYIKDQLRDEILNLDNTNGIAKRVERPVEEIVSQNVLDPLKIVSIDSAVVSSRHLFRLPYSLHEKTSLVSVPITIQELDKFSKEDASIGKVKVKLKFLTDRLKLKEATSLIIEALDFVARHRPEETKTVYRGPDRKIKYFTKKYFPPCILKLLEGNLIDGKKRALFILITFLRNVGWDWDQIEKEIFEWNQRNVRQLRTNYIKSQLRWHRLQKKNILPPNCDHPNFYKALGVYEDGAFHKTVKNPVNYPYKKLKRE